MPFDEQHAEAVWDETDFGEDGEGEKANPEACGCWCGYGYCVGTGGGLRAGGDHWGMEGGQKRRDRCTSREHDHNADSCWEVYDVLHEPSGLSGLAIHVESQTARIDECMAQVRKNDVEWEAQEGLQV